MPAAVFLMLAAVFSLLAAMFLHPVAGVPHLVGDV